MSVPLPLLNELLTAQLQGRADLQAQVTDGGFWAGGGVHEGRLGPWSTLLCDGQVFPGASGYNDLRAVALMSIDGNLRFRIDSQKVRGRSGHKLNVEAYEPTPIRFTVRLWRAQQWAAFQAYLPQVSPKLQANTREKLAKLHRYRLQHPVLSAYGLSEFFLHDVALPKDADGRMVKDVTFEALEAWDLKPTGVKTVKQGSPNFAGLIASAFKVNAPDPVTPALQNVPIAQQAAALPQLSLTPRPMVGQPFKFPLDPRPR